MPTPTPVRWWGSGPSMTSVYSSCAWWSRSIRAAASAPSTLRMPWTQGAKSRAARCEAAEVPHSGEPALLMLRSQASTTSAKVRLLSPMATTMCEQIAESVSSSLMPKAPPASLLMTRMTPWTCRPSPKRGMQRTLRILMPMLRKTSGSAGRQRASSPMSAMFTYCPVEATWPTKPSPSPQRKSLGMLAVWWERTSSPRSLSTNISMTASAPRIWPTLLMTLW
mmetsp:Transcript_126282/g.357141  ORF Transcript_126282/g.357141 Transcript_126282/m.357141 type:complete len:223 (-) Transcript_126282:503-1171(-)